MSKTSIEVEKTSKIDGGYSFFRKKIVKGNSFEKNKLHNSGNGNKSLDKIIKKNDAISLKSNKSFSKNNSSISNLKNEKGQKYSNFTKTTETRSNATNNKNGGKNSTIKSSTAITTITTTSNSKDKRLPSGNREIFKSATNIRSLSNQGNKSLLINQKTASNKKSKSKGENIISQKTYSTLVATPSSNRRKQIVPSQSSFNLKNNYASDIKKKINTNNEKTLISQKSTPSLKGILNSQNKNNEKKRTMSIISQDGILKNIASLFIDETKKKPKKEYVLKERKTETIQIKNKVRMEYKNDPNIKEAVNTDLNHTIKIVREVSKDRSTAKQLPKGANYSSHVINETRKNEVVKTEISGRQSHNNYDNFIQKKKLIPLPKKEQSSMNFRDKNKNINITPNISNIYNTRTNDAHNNNNSKIGYYTTSTNRNRSETGNKKNPVGQSIKSTTTKVTETRTIRGKTEDKKPGANDKTKITITKITEIKSGNRGKQLKIPKGSSNANELGKKGPKNKIQTLSISQIISNEKDKKRNKSQSGNEGNIIKTTESSNAGKRGNDLKNNKSGKSNQEDTRTSKVKTERSEKVTNKTTTTTTSTTNQVKNQPSEGNGGAAKVIKFKSFRMQKKNKL